MFSFLSFLREETKEKHHVMTFMRANPPTEGHHHVVNQVTDLAKSLGGSHEVVLSHSHDPDKNPLSPRKKLYFARKSFPGANISVASKAEPSILHHAAKAMQTGAQHLHVVVGADRVKEFGDLLNKYNGKEGKYGSYNYKSITVHSAGERDPNAKGLTGISGTKMRAAARSGDRNTFYGGISPAMDNRDKEHMLHAVAGVNRKKI